MPSLLNIWGNLKEFFKDWQMDFCDQMKEHSPQISTLRSKSIDSSLLYEVKLRYYNSRDIYESIITFWRKNFGISSINKMYHIKIMIRKDCWYYNILSIESTYGWGNLEETKPLFLLNFAGLPNWKLRNLVWTFTKLFIIWQITSYNILKIR